MVSSNIAMLQGSGLSIEQPQILIVENQVVETISYLVYRSAVRFYGEKFQAELREGEICKTWGEEDTC